MGQISVNNEFYLHISKFPNPRPDKLTNTFLEYSFRVHYLFTIFAGHGLRKTPQVRINQSNLTKTIEYE